MNVTNKIDLKTFKANTEKLILRKKFDHLIKVCENQEKLDTSILKDVLDKFMILYKNNIQFKKQVEMLENQLKEEKNKRANVSETCQRVNTLAPKTKPSIVVFAAIAPFDCKKYHLPYASEARCQGNHL